MTLPIQTLCNDKATPTAAAVTAQQLRVHTTGRRRPACLSAAWADPPPLRRERRRAICSWSPPIGYGTLDEAEENLSVPPVDDKQDIKSYNQGKVAEHVTLLDPRGRRLVSSSTSALSLPTHAPSVGNNSVFKSQSRRPARSRLTEPLLTAMPGIWSLWRRNAPPLLDSAQAPLVVKATSLENGKGNGGGNEPPAITTSIPRTPPLPVVQSASSLANLRKCETVLALKGYLRSSSSSSSIEPLQPINRLRVPSHASVSRMCSRCSSLLTLASSSRYSLNSTTGGFVHVPQEEPPILCKLCLIDIPAKEIMKISVCGCGFCKECMKAYVEFEINEGAYDISCPDAQCPSQGILQEEEIKRLAGNDYSEKHKKYRLNREVELDKSRTWCPRAGCETICSTCPALPCAPQSVFCPTCANDFCSNCKLEWHEGMTCEEFSKQQGKAEPGIPFDSDLIKCCPMCNVPIEKDEGCAQMMCKRCKHVFCWYCLASLDDDFLLRHYDKGPCKNKLGHSRASVIWHRTQVIGIFAGFGILLLVASPLLLLAAPCIVCCKCRLCNTGTTKLDNEDEVPGEQS